MYRRVHFFCNIRRSNDSNSLQPFYLINLGWHKFSFYPYSSILVITFKGLGNVLPFFDKVFIISVFSWTSGFSNFLFLYKIPHLFSPTLERTHVSCFLDIMYLKISPISCNLQFRVILCYTRKDECISISPGTRQNR